MRVVQYYRMKLFSGTANKPLAEQIAQKLGTTISSIELFIFPDGERRIRIVERVVDEDCVVIQSASPPVDDNYMELFFIVDGLKRSGAKSITAVVPYFGYQRQDHIFRDGEAVSLEVMIRFIESVGINRLITVDLHASRIPDLFHIPVEHVSALPVFAEKVREIINNKFEYRISKSETNPNDGNSNDKNKNQNGKSFENSNFEHLNIVSDFGFRISDFPILISPDMGGIRRIKQISELLDGMPWAALEKNRDLESGTIAGDVVREGSIAGKKIAFIVDDMISSGKTIALAAKVLKKVGIEKNYVFATHAVFSEETKKIIMRAPVEKVFVTDSVFIAEDKKFAKLEIVSIGDIIVKEIQKYV